MAEARDGGCACGRVRYRLGSAPMYVHCCHCTECRRLSGAAFAVNAPIETDRVVLLADRPRAVTVPRGSGRSQPIQSCPGCGTKLWSHHPDLGERIAFVFVGTLDDPGAFPPAMHCFTRSKLPWVVLPAGARTAPGHYGHEACWPAGSLERLRAALA